MSNYFKASIQYGHTQEYRVQLSKVKILEKSNPLNTKCSLLSFHETKCTERQFWQSQIQFYIHICLQKLWECKGHHADACSKILIIPCLRQGYQQSTNPHSWQIQKTTYNVWIFTYGPILLLNNYQPMSHD